MVGAAPYAIALVVAVARPLGSSGFDRNDLGYALDQMGHGHALRRSIAGGRSANAATFWVGFPTSIVGMVATGARPCAPTTLMSVAFANRPLGQRTKPLKC